MTVKKVVLTGGPCSGKTTILRVLREEFGDDVLLIPEVATVFLENGFPVPGRDLPWCEEWQSWFQSAVLPTQVSLEEAYVLMAEKRGQGLVVCDRGVLDGAAYTPGGLEEFCRRFRLDAEASLERYAAVIHLESIATAAPERYGQAENLQRFEPLERAQALEAATFQAWSGHPTHIFIDGKRPVERKINEVMGIIRFLVADARAEDRRRTRRPREGRLLPIAGPKRRPVGLAPTSSRRNREGRAQG